MTKIQELEIADRERKEIGAQVDHVKFHLQNLESNIALLRSIQIQYKQNIAILKSKKYITSIQEYRKIRTELHVVNSRLNVMQIDLNNHAVALDRVKKMLFDADEKYATLLKNQDAPVIRGKFGKK